LVSDANSQIVNSGTVARGETLLAGIRNGYDGEVVSAHDLDVF
jgi:hypothetical protein